ncbi:rod shape-determining protein MreD [Owenweeksia hongkongensis]|uniref:rod shape-determining protein MreD n=1 Tax=Owenweeksia hongkongensis TaxID=253245 RepID=UPI003A8E1E3F
MITARNILSFLVLVLFQVFILNNIDYSGYLNPYVYILFVMMLPVKVPRSTVLILAFLIGLCIDMFENSGGVHIAATVFLAYIRIPLLKVATQKRGEDFLSVKPSKLGLGNLIVYALLCILIHHFLLFLIESYSFRDIGTVLVRTMMSSIFTFVFVLLVQLWNFRKKDRI